MRNRVLDGGEGADQVDIEGGTEFLHGKLLDPSPRAIDAGIGHNYIEPPQVSTVVAIAERTESSSLTSHVRVMAVPPAPPIASATSLSDPMSGLPARLWHRAGPTTSPLPARCLIRHQ
jgi:hypothetical protein